MNLKRYRILQALVITGIMCWVWLRSGVNTEVLVIAIALTNAVLGADWVAISDVDVTIGSSDE